MRRRLVYDIGLILLSIALLILIILACVPRILGYKTFVVVSESMEPTLSVGELIYVRDNKVSEIKEGDIVTFKSGNIIGTHRVVSKTVDNKLMTKGDANNTTDSRIISDKELIGSVAGGVKGIGYITMCLQTRVGITTLVILLMILFYLRVIKKCRFGGK